MKSKIFAGLAILILLASAVLLFVPISVSGSTGVSNSRLHTDSGPTSPFVFSTTGTTSVTVTVSAHDVLYAWSQGLNGAVTTISDSNSLTWNLVVAHGGEVKIWNTTATSSGPDIIAVGTAGDLVSVAEVNSGQVLASGTDAYPMFPAALPEPAVGLFTGLGGGSCPVGGGTSWNVTGNIVTTGYWCGVAFAQNVSASYPPEFSYNATFGSGLDASYNAWVELPVQPIPPLPPTPFVVVASGLYSISLTTTSGDTLFVAIFGSSGISDTQSNSWTLEPSSCSGFSYLYTTVTSTTGPDTISTPGLAPYSAAWAFEVITGTILAQGTSPTCSTETASPAPLGVNAVAVFTSVNQGGASCPTTGGTAWIFVCQDTGSAQGWGGFSQNVTSGTSPVLSTNSSTGNYFVWFEIPVQPIPPLAPTSLSGVATGQTTADLVWVNPSGSLTDSYVNQYLGGACGGSPTTFNLGSAQSSDTVTGLTANTTYGFEVAAANAAGQGPFGPCVLVQTEPYNQKVVFPSVLAVAATGQTTAVASWSAPQNASPSAYELTWGTTYGTYGSNSGALSSSTLHVAVTGLSANTTYYFILVPTGAPNSNVAPLHTFSYNQPVVAPPILSVTDLSSTSVALTWTAGRNITAANYTLERGTVFGTYGTHTSLGTSTFHTTVTGLTQSTLYYFIVVEWTSAPTIFTSNPVPVQTSAAAAVLDFTGTTEIANGGGSASSSGGVTVSAYNEATCATIPTVSSCVLDGAVSSNASGTWALYGMTAATYYIVTGTTPATGPEKFGGATLQETYSASTVTGINLQGSPFVGYGNATFVLPNFACYGQYQAKVGGIHDCQTPVLAWTQDGAFYVNSASNLVFYSFINASVTVIHHWTLLNQTFASYNMVPNQLFATQDGSYIYSWGTLVAGYNSGDALTFEAVNITTHKFFEYNFTGVTEADVHANGQVLMTGWDGNDSTVVLTIASGAMFYYNIWTGVQTSGQTLDYFEANNDYWVPFLNGFINVHTEGSKADNVEEWQLSSGSSPTLTMTFTNTWGPGTCTMNGVDGVIYNVTAHLLYLSGGSASCGNNFVTYHVNPTTGTLATPVTVVNTPETPPYNTVLLGVNSAADRNALMSEGPLMSAFQRGFFNYSILFSPTTGVFEATNTTSGIWNEVLKAYATEQYYQEGQFFNASYFIQELSTGCSQGLGSLASICSVNTTGYSSGTIWYDWQQGLSEFPDPKTAAIAQPTAPAAPTAVAVEQTFTSDRLAWVTGAGSNPVVNWSVFYTVNGSSPTHLDLWAQNTSVTLSGLPLKSVVAYCVQEWNLHWESACASGSVSNNPPPPVQTIPVLSAAATGQQTASLSWTAPQNFSVMNYKIYLGTTYALALALGDLIATESASTFTYSVTTLNTNTTYWFVVVAVAASSAVLVSNVAPIQTWQDNQLVVGAPILSVVATTQTQVTLAWTLPTNMSPAGYVLDWGYAYAVPSFNEEVFELDTTVTGLTENTTYWFAVYAVNGGGAPLDGGHSNWAPAQTWAFIVVAPVLSVVAIDYNSVDLAWTAPANVSVVNYTVEFGTAFGSYPTHISEGVSFDATVTGLNVNTTYWFIVQTWTGVSTEGPVSNPAPAQTLSLKGVAPPVIVAPVLSVSSYGPSPLNPVSGGDNPFTVMNWTAPQNVTVTSYTLYATPYADDVGAYASWPSNPGGFKVIEGNVNGNVTQLVNWNDTYEFVVCTNTGLCSNVLLYNEPTVYPVAEVASVVATTQTSVNVTWTAAQNFVYDTNVFTGGFLTWSVDNYTLLWGTVYGVWTGSQSEGPALSAQVNGLTANTTYYFEVEVWFTNHNDVGTSHLITSNFALAHTKDYAPVIPPAGCSLSNLAQCPANGGGLPAGFWTDDFIIIIVVSVLTMMIGLMLARRDDETDES